MKLTPVNAKRRAKRHRQKLNSQVAPKTSAEKDDTAERVEQRKKPRMSRSRINQSPLERLPVEILEQIFCLSENLNLARCTPAMGARLSARGTLLAVIMAAFEPTWREWFGKPKRDVTAYERRLLYGAGVPGSSVFQTEVLGCRWMTLDLILDAQQVWYNQNRRFQTKLYRHTTDWAIRLPNPDGTTTRVGGTSHRPHMSSGIGHGNNPHECFQIEWDGFLHRDNGLLSFGAYMAERTANARGYISVHPDTMLPNDIFTGQHTWAGARLLFWLVLGGARLSRSQTWEVTVAGYERIMALPDEKLAIVFLRLFAMLGVFGPHWPLSLLRERLEDARLRASEFGGERRWRRAADLLYYHNEAREELETIEH